MLDHLPIVFALIAATAFATLVAGWTGAPHAIVLVVLGLALALLPGLPTVSLDPELALLLFLPPLLYSSGVAMSWRGFKYNLRPILLLAIGCVLFTATAVAAAAHWLFGLPWAVGFVLGAVVSPPDAVAPMAIARRLSAPKRILTVLEGEGLVNDATALILFGFALAAVETGGVSVLGALGKFAIVVVGEVVWGLGIAGATLRLRRFARNPQVEIVIALLTPFLAFWPPHHFGGSGVIATVVAGLYVSWNGPRFIAPATRLQGFFVWNFVVFLIEGVLFLLTGLQAHAALGTAKDWGWERLLGAGLVISAVVVLVRFAWVFPATYLPRLWPGLRKRDPAPPWAWTFVIGFTGIRGVVSLAAALSIPFTLGDKPFAERGMIVFVTFFVILVTLVGQGMTLPWVIRRLGLAQVGDAEAAEAKRQEVAARAEGVRAALARLDQLERDGADKGLVLGLRRRHGERLAHLVATGDDRIPGSPTADSVALSFHLVAAERERIGRAYFEGGLDDEARRRIERELDLEEARLHHAAESALGADNHAGAGEDDGGDPAKPEEKVA